MAVFGNDMDRPLYGHAPSPGLRFTIYAILALVLMYYDQRGQWTQRVRYYLLATAYPVQLIASSPSSAWRWLQDSLQTRAVLRAENTQLRSQQRALELSVLRESALQRENTQLRALRQALPPLVKSWRLAEVVSVDTNPLRQRLVINKGAHDGVRENEVVVDATGILGQIARVGPWSAEVILVSDPEHALPVQIARNELRTIAVGSGNSGELLLPYLPGNADVRNGDLLVSSGLGGVFPAGYPVATVTGVTRVGNQVRAQVRARPLANIERDREVMLLTFNAANPAAPAAVPPIAAQTPDTKAAAQSKPAARSADPR